MAIGRKGKKEASIDTLFGLFAQRPNLKHSLCALEMKM